MGGHKGIVYSVVYSPDGNTLASGGGGNIRLWDTITKKRKFTISEPRIHHGNIGSVDALAFSPNSEIVVSGDNQVIEFIYGMRQLVIINIHYQITKVI